MMSPSNSTLQGVLRLALVLCLGLAGCNYLGAILAKFDDTKVPAEYKPPKERMLVLVEDSKNPDLAGILADRVMTNVSDDLAQHKVKPQVDPRGVIDWRDENRDVYRGMSLQDLARHFGAKQILYVDITSYEVDSPIGSETAKGSMLAKVRVIDAKTGETRWPVDVGSKILKVESPTLPVRTEGSVEPINDYLVDRLSQRVSQMFYEHPEETPELSEDTETSPVESNH